MSPFHSAAEPRGVRGAGSAEAVPWLRAGPEWPPRSLQGQQAVEMAFGAGVPGDWL